MTLRTQFSLAGLALLLPLVWVTYLLSNEMNIRIDFGAKEIVGDQYLRPLQPLLDSAGAHQTLLAAGQSASEAATGFDQALTDVRKFQQQVGAGLKSEEQFRGLTSAWDKARNAAAGDPAHNALTAAARALIARVGDTSNLILDPDLDTYYIMDALLLKLPDSLDLQWQIRELGERLLRAGQVSADDKTHMVVLTGLLQADLDGIVYDAQVAFENNSAKDLPQAVQTAVDTYKASVGTLQAWISEHITGAQLQVDLAGFTASTEAARSANLQLYALASPALETMLQRRIAGFGVHKWTLLTAVVVFEAIVLALTVLMIRRILKQLGGEPQYAADIVRNVAAGDLTQAVNLQAGDDSSLLAGIRHMQEALQRLIGQVRTSARQILDVAESLAQASSAVVDGSRRQSSATATMSSAVLEVSASLQQMVASSGQANQLTVDSRQRCDQSEQMVRDVAEDIGKLCNFIEESAQSVQDLGQQSEQIYSIVNTIKGIAEQTNLLALNAAIEAARAGEQGRGFAVVADEVRNLAARTASSTLEITDMISRIKTDTQAVASRMAQGVSDAGQSTGRIQQAVETIGAVNHLSRDVNQSVEEISRTLEEQAKANELLSQNVDEVAQMAERNSATVEQTADTLQRLQALANEFESAIASFRV